MNLIELARQYPDMSITVRLCDLVDANRRLVEEARRDARRETLADAAEEKAQELIPRMTLAKRLHVDLSTLYDWDQNGLLPAVRIGRKVYYRPEDVDRLVSRKTPTSK